MTLVTSLSIIRGGTTLDISDEVSYIHEQNDGFGMAPLHRLTERGPLQDGATDQGYRLDPRTVNLVIPILGDSWSDRYTKRQTLLRMLVPGDDVVKVRFVDPDSNTYQLDGHVVAGPMFGSPDRLGQDFKAAFTIYCPDPTWYDPTAYALNFQLGGGGDMMEVPTVIPMTVGGSTIDASQSIDYTGTYKSYPTIRITGPITDCVITNNATGDKLDFTGTTIGAGAYYDIDLRYGYKTVTNNSGTNKIAELTSDSDLSTFAIIANPPSTSYNNSISVSGSAITAATNVVVTYYRRFIGV